jgi:hypothetical protein
MITRRWKKSESGFFQLANDRDVIGIVIQIGVALLLLLLLLKLNQFIMVAARSRETRNCTAASLHLYLPPDDIHPHPREKESHVLRMILIVASSTLARWNSFRDGAAMRSLRTRCDRISYRTLRG